MSLSPVLSSFCFYVISSWLEYNKKLTSSVRYLNNDKTGTTAYRTAKKLEGEKQVADAEEDE